MALRHNFPPYASRALGGESDGLRYRTTFAGSTMADTLEMVRAFLDEEGYGDVPIPAQAEDMLAFLRPAAGRPPSLFEEAEYAHYPVRLILPRTDRRRRQLRVELFNESAPDSLLRFHRRQCPEREGRIERAIHEQHLSEYGAFIQE